MPLFNVYVYIKEDGEIVEKFHQHRVSLWGGGRTDPFVRLEKSFYILYIYK
jgi:hypothetical protein